MSRRVVAVAVMVVALCGVTHAVGGGARDEVARVAGAARLGALFAVRVAPASAAVAGAAAPCGRVREHYGVQRVEATLQALDWVRRELPELQLGGELRDSCWAPHTALRQAIRLALPRAERPAPPPHSSVCRRTQESGEEVEADEAAEGGQGGEESPLVGVLGPGASAAAAHVQNLLQLFHIPQVSYSATSRELSDRARYPTFHRVAPSDVHQARLLAALLAAHNFTYVHALHTDETYGQGGLAALRAAAARRGVCLAREEPLRAAPAPREVDAALARLARAAPAVRVAVCWCEGRTARALLAGVARLPPAARPLLLASDGWADRRDVVHGLEHAAAGALTVRVRSPYLHTFDAYYHSLDPRTNTRNPWFREFWEQKFNCSISPSPPPHEVPCSGAESLAREYTQEPKLALVVRGVLALAYALRDMRAALCPPPGAGSGLCAAMLPFNHSLYGRYLARVRFRAPDGGLVAFDHNGDPPPELSEYDVMRLVRRGGGEGWVYERVGRWRGGRLRLAGGAAGGVERAGGRRASCSAPCAPGRWARRGAGRASCCTTCVPCAPGSVVRAPPAPPGCRACPPGHHPDATRTVCVLSTLEWGGGAWAGPARWAAGVGGAGALLVCAALAGALWRHRDTACVRAASRELAALLLASAALAGAAALAAAARPSPAVCAARRLAPPALAGVYAATLARTMRMHRLVEAAHHATTPSFISSRAQVVVWMAMVAPSWALAAWALGAGGGRARLQHPGGGARRVLACGGESARALLVPLLAPGALLAAAAALHVARRARPLPRALAAREREALWAGGAAWLAGGVGWAGGGGAARQAALGAAGALAAAAAALLALGGAAWLAVFRPQLNTRARFLTAAPELRCHLGRYRVPPAPDRSPDRTCDVAVEADLRPALRSRGVQAGAAAGAVCERAGVCARITQRANDVTIALLHHHHHQL